MNKFSLGTSAFLFLVLVPVHFLCLRFVFPGYYDPFTPQHADFYMPAALSQVPLSSLLSWPRPMGVSIAHFAGFLGVQGSIAVTIASIFANLVLTRHVVMRATGASGEIVTFAAFLLFTTLCFTQPYFYTFAVEDAYANYALTFLLSGIFLYQAVSDRHHSVAVTVAFLFALLGFLCKETYVVSSLLLVGLVARTVGRAIALGLAFAFAAVLSFGIEAARKSMFTDVSSAADSPYKVDISPSSVVRILWQYLDVGYSAPLLAILLVLFGSAAVLAWYRGQTRIAVALALLPLAGLAAIAPVAVLPNHIFNGYSWAAAIFIFAPLLVVPTIRVNSERPVASAVSCLAVGIAVVVASMTFFQYGDDDKWVVFEENIQRHAMIAMAFFLAQPGLESGEKKVLVTGITFPFTVFHHDMAVLKDLPNKLVRFDGLLEGTWVFPDGAITHWLSKEDVDLTKYDRVWMFRDDGTAIGVADPHDPLDREVIRKNTGL